MNPLRSRISLFSLFETDISPKLNIVFSEFKQCEFVEHFQVTMNIGPKIQKLKSGKHEKGYIYRKNQPSWDVLFPRWCRNIVVHSYWSQSYIYFLLLCLFEAISTLFSFSVSCTSLLLLCIFIFTSRKNIVPLRLSVFSLDYLDTVSRGDCRRLRHLQWWKVNDAQLPVSITRQISPRSAGFTVRPEFLPLINAERKNSHVVLSPSPVPLHDSTGPINPA